MSTTLTTLASGHVVRGETRSSGALLRLLLLTAALSATAGALATAVLDRLANASAPPRLAPVAAQAPVTAGGRDPSVPDAGSVFLGREAAPEDPVATF
jgi:hypothetical protein